MKRRLYLDTGDLFDIGDGRIAPVTVAELATAMDASDTVLVVSYVHYLDAARGGQSSVESLVRAVAMFPRAAAVTRAPEKVEPLSAERSDIHVEACADFRTLLSSDDLRDTIAGSIDMNDQLHAGDLAAHNELLAVRRRHVWSLRHAELGATAIARLAASDAAPEALLATLEQEFGSTVPPGERTEFLSIVRAARAFFGPARPAAQKHAVDLGEALRTWWEAWVAPARYPGMRLGVAGRAPASDQRDSEAAAQ